MNKLSFFAVLSLGLLMVVLLLTNWGLRLTEEKKTVYGEKQELYSQIAALDELKIGLKMEVDSLMNSYGKVAKENELLEKLLRNSNTKLTKSKYDFQQFRMESTSTIQSLKESIQQLVKAKSTLETTIQETNNTNNLLLDQAGIDRITFKEIMNDSDNPEVAFQQLQGAYSVVQDNRKAAATDARLQQIRANQKPRAIDRKVLRATAFRTELEMKNGKATVKARRVKMVVVSFDLEEVPDIHIGEQELFLVINNERQQLLKKEPIKATISIKGLKQSIKTIQSKKIELDKNQRVTFNYEVEEKMKEGYYLVYVYAKSGLLGETSFRVE